MLLCHLQPLRAALRAWLCVQEPPANGGSSGREARNMVQLRAEEWNRPLFSSWRQATLRSVRKGLSDEHLGLTYIHVHVHIIYIHIYIYIYIETCRLGRATLSLPPL